MTTLHLVGIAGSLRQQSYNRALLYAAAEQTPPDATLTVLDISSVPLYNGDVEQQGMPPAVQGLRATVGAADGVIIATPEYNWSVPGVLKNVLDWLSRPPDSPLFGKPLGILGASTGYYGTARAQLHLRQMVAPMHVMNMPNVLVNRAGDKFADDGTLTDAATADQLRAFMVAFVAWVQLIQSGTP